ncbi:MAG: Gfo/Idh/MocA family oxidoreductase [Firmicutes bacterium]|nr:Gfo/Idh/MocA family oxidoreductase [Bacillota bacterium]
MFGKDWSAAMKLAVIGTGNWGKNIVRTLDGLGVLAAAADQAAEWRAAIKKEYPQVEVYSDYQPILESDITAVAIATPAPSHYRIAAEAIRAGKDVFVEKPMTLSAAEAEELAQLAVKEGKILMVGHLLLYQPAIQWLKKELDSEIIGEIGSLHQERLGLGRARESESVLWDLGVHDLAVLLYLSGRELLESKVCGQRRLRSGIEDDIYLHLSFTGNLQAHLHTSWIWPERRRRLTITGAKGMLVYDELEQTVTLHRKGIKLSDLTNWDQGAEVVFKGDGAPLTLELEHFIDCVRNRRTPISDGFSGAAVVRLLEELSRQLREEGSPLIRN